MQKEKNFSNTMTNREIIDANLGLLAKCVKYQFAKCSNKDLAGDFLNDLYLILLDYDNAKLLNAYEEGHLNALITRIIINNIHSNTSEFYRKYRKFLRQKNDIEEIKNEEDSDNLRDTGSAGGYGYDESD